VKSSTTQGFLQNSIELDAYIDVCIYLIPKNPSGQSSSKVKTIQPINSTNRWCPLSFLNLPTIFAKLRPCARGQGVASRSSTCVDDKQKMNKRSTPRTSKY